MHVHARTYVRMYVHTYIRTYVCMHACMRAGSQTPIILIAVPGNTTEYHALFNLPSDLVEGQYTAEISNGLSTTHEPQWTKLTMFASPADPEVSKITIVEAHVWKPEIFTVDCELSKPLFQRPCGWVGARSSTQVDDALAKAKVCMYVCIHVYIYVCCMYKDTFVCVYMCVCVCVCVCV